jgi:NADPH2:quinone reductase
MKAIRVNTNGGPEVMTLEDLPTPAPAAGQALVRVEAAGVNYIDVYQRMAIYKLPLPFTLGQEAAGTVERVGDGVTLVKVGDRVAWAGVMGAYADYAVVAAERLVTLPPTVTTREGAAIMLQGTTAHYLACSTFPLKPGDTCVVHAGAGGVGLLLTQIAKLRGARVISTVSTAAKAELATAAGADEVVQYTVDDFESAVKRATGGTGAQVVYDSVGATTFMKSLGSLAPRGMLVLFGQSSGVVPPIDLAILAQKGSLFVTRPTLGHYIATSDELRQRTTDLFGWIANRQLRLRIDQEFPLAAAVDAHIALEGRKTTGKVLLIP